MRICIKVTSIKTSSRNKSVDEKKKDRSWDAPRVFPHTFCDSLDNSLKSHLLFHLISRRKIYNAAGGERGEKLFIRLLVDIFLGVYVVENSCLYAVNWLLTDRKNILRDEQSFGIVRVAVRRRLD